MTNPGCHLLGSHAVTMFFYMFIVISSGLMFNAVTKDKENKTIEMLLSANFDLFIGKMLHLAIKPATDMCLAGNISAA